MLQQAVVIALVIMFLNATTWEGMIFHGIRKLIDPEAAISKPIYNCPICMGPWWGTLIYILFFHESFKSYLLTVGAASGLCVIAVILLAIREKMIE